MSQTKVAYITHYLPSYRFDILDLLVVDFGIELSVYSDKNERDGFDLSSTKKNLFNVIDSKVNVFSCFGKEFYFQADVLKILMRKEYDVYILSSLKSDASVWIGLFFGLLFNRKIVLWGHNKHKRSTIDRFLTVSMLSLSKANIFYSETERSKWLNFKAIQKKSFTAPNTIVFKANKISSEKVFIQPAFGNPDNPTLIFSARLTESKNIPILLKALSNLKEQKHLVNLIIIGDGPIKYQLNSIIKDFDIFDQVFFAGPVFDIDIISYYYSKSQLAVIPSWAGLSVNQAFANKVSVLTDNDFVNHPPEVCMIIENSTGFFYQKGDVDDLSNVIINVTSDLDLLKKCGENAYDLYINSYSPQKMVYGIFKSIEHAK